MRYWIKEVWLAMGQTLRQHFFEKQTLLLLLCGTLMLVAMLVSMDDVKDEKSKIAIGIADADRSDFSQKVIAAMQQIDLYEVTVGKEEELLECLSKKELAAVCVLKERLESRVARGKSDNLVTIYETEDSTAMLVGDILAGVMMQEICMAKGYQTLLDYEKKTGREASLTLEEYRQYVAEVLEEEGTEFAFEVTYVSQNSKMVSKPSRTILYEQAVLAVFAMMIGLLSVYAVLPFRKLRHGGLARRLKTLPVHGSALYIGSAFGALLIPMIFGAVFLNCYAYRNQVQAQKLISLHICTMLYICVIVCMMLLAAYIIKSQTVYQMGMLAMILIFGVCGLVSLVDGLLLPEGTVTWVPNGWFVRRMTEILNNG